ncbi:MAG: VOC family protein [Acidobacteriaceae bacterium]|nr:VOC family protein [Acidobacteriaceae bacterium]
MSKSESFGLKHIGQIGLTVNDVKKATEFYRDTLGMRLLFEAGNLSFFDCGGIRMMLGPAEQPDQPKTILYYKVDDIQKACDTLASRGARIERAPGMVARMPDHELWLAVVRDMDDNLFELMSEVRK